jgi:hypothetical protein
MKTQPRLILLPRATVQNTPGVVLSSNTATWPAAWWKATGTPISSKASHIGSKWGSPHALPGTACGSISVRAPRSTQRWASVMAASIGPSPTGTATAPMRRSGAWLQKSSNSHSL